MKLHKLSYILLMLLPFLWSCKDDLMADTSQGNTDGGDPRILKIDLLADLPELRTRDINMDPGSTLELNEIWVGVFERNTGVKVADNSESFGNRLTASGSTVYNAIQIELPADYDSQEDLCIVGVVNYEGIVTEDGTDLYSALIGASEWNDFRKVTVSYSMSDFKDNTPLLMGFYYDRGSDSSARGYVYTKVDQFSYINSPDEKGIHVYGNNDIFIEKIAGSDATGWQSYNSSNRIMKLRRLRSKINVNVNPIEGLTVNQMWYKRYNMPQSVYLTQYRTNDFTENLTDITDRKYSPNRADVMEEYLYVDDPDWIPVEHLSFSFEHLENKHWAKSGATPANYREREKKNSDGSFSSLADAIDDWNNDASYFVLKLNMTNLNTGRNAEVQYTIHEGFCNDVNGNMYDSSGNPVTMAVKASDFSCVRNTNYTYNITVNGFTDIIVNVEQEGETGYNHDDTQQGDVWQMKYAGGSPVTISDNATKYYPDVFEFQDNPNLAFRLCGYDDTGRLVDVCYNFARGRLDNVIGIWPQPTNESYYQDGDNLGFDNVPANIRDRVDALRQLVKVYVSDDLQGTNGFEVEIFDFIANFNRGDYAGKKFGFAMTPYERTFEGDVRNQLRGLYIFDRKDVFEEEIEPGSHIAQDEEGCCRIFTIYAGEQYPFDGRVPLVMPAFSPETETLMDYVNQYVTYRAPLPAGIEASEIGTYWQYEAFINDDENVMFPGTVAGNEIEFRIPLSMVRLYDTVNLRLAPIDTQRYKNTTTTELGSVVLLDPDWKKGESDWDKALSYYATAANRATDFTGGEYLSITAIEGKTIEPADSNTTLKLSGAANTFKFRIYKPCNITVTAKSNSTTERWIVVNYGSNQKLSIDTGNTNITMTAALDFEGEYLDVSVSNGNGGMTFSEIRLGEYDESRESNLK